MKIDDFLVEFLLMVAFLYFMSHLFRISTLPETFLLFYWSVKTRFLFQFHLPCHSRKVGAVLLASRDR